MNRKEFTQEILKGKWHLIEIKGTEFLVKFKFHSEIETGYLETLWLSNRDHESMCFSDFKHENWDIINGSFIGTSAYTYHFGSSDSLNEESIYNESGHLNVEKMKRDILNYCSDNFVTPDELDKIWSLIEKSEFTEFTRLEVK
ncbi:hypothetical protein [Bacillus cereus]|uniref:hypothetical protein n=1 Tax=Bacillus cereus TaxID=1396 RepID=UPI000B4ACE0E|nr:hypothetical protein [Bacillus cereus]